MKPFKEVIDGIRNAVLGKEVREDIAQLGEYVEQFANTAGENIQKAIDPTLTLTGKAADAAKVGEAVGQLKEDIDYLRHSVLSVDLCSGTYIKGYWDWVSDYFYVVPSNEFICENGYHENVKTGDKFIVTKPDNISGALVVMFNNHTNVSTTDSSLLVTIPEGVTKFAVWCVSTMTLSDFGGFTVRQFLKTSDLVDKTITLTNKVNTLNDVTASAS